MLAFLWQIADKLNVFTQKFKPFEQIYNFDQLDNWCDLSQKV